MHELQLKRILKVISGELNAFTIVLKCSMAITICDASKGVGERCCRKSIQETFLVG